MNCNFTHHFKIVFVKLFKSVVDNDPEFNNGFITEAQSTPPLCAAIFLFLTSHTYVAEKTRIDFDKSVNLGQLQANCQITLNYSKSADWDADAVCIQKIVYVYIYNAVLFDILPLVTILFIRNARNRFDCNAHFKSTKFTNEMIKTH